MPEKNSTKSDADRDPTRGDQSGAAAGGAASTALHGPFEQQPGDRRRGTRALMVARPFQPGRSRWPIRTIGRSAAILLTLLFCLPKASPAWYPRLVEDMKLTPETVVIGRHIGYIVAPGETLMEIARRAGLGFDNLQRANPGLDPWAPPAGRRLLLPKAFLPPEELLRPGITVNLAELRLYLVWEVAGQHYVRVYPVGIGREGWDTPRGDFAVSVIIEEPSWTPPAELRREKPELPGTVPPGADNPLGSRWIGLTAEGVGIHGTNQPYGIGRRISHGCIQLYPRDILDLADRVVPGTPVRIIDRPLKHRLHNGRLHLEVHRPQNNEIPTGLPRGDWNPALLRRALLEARGVPVAIPFRQPGTGEREKAP